MWEYLENWAVLPPVDTKAIIMEKIQTVSSILESKPAFLPKEANDIQILTTVYFVQN
jgi:hypothetical protein